MTSPEPGVKRLSVEAQEPTEFGSSRLKRILLLSAEVSLILVIVALLTLIWLPAWLGPHLGIGPHQ